MEHPFITIDPTQYFYIWILLLLAINALVYLIALLKERVTKQIDSQLAKMIPIKGLRDKIAIKVKWR